MSAAAVTEAAREAQAEELFQWIQTARKLIDAHFPREGSAAHNTMVIETARTLMLAGRLGTIETAVRDLSRALATEGDD